MSSARMVLGRGPRRALQTSPASFGALFPAFTLVEMLVAMAVLAMALTIVGVVFNVTTRTVSQAAALTEMQIWLRQFTNQLEEDLAYVNPSESVLVVVGRTQAAALTQDQLNARQFYRVLVGDPARVQSGYNPLTNPSLDTSPGGPHYSNPRADVIGFFTHRPLTSQAPRLRQSGESDASYRRDPHVAGARFAPSFVVYGHAAKGRALRQADGRYAWDADPASLRHIEETTASGGTDRNVQSVLPANQWMLARRATLVEPPPTGTRPPSVPTFNPGNSQVERDRILRCQPTNDGQLPGDVAPLFFDEVITWFQRTPGASLPARACPYEDAGAGNSFFAAYAQRRQFVNGLLYVANNPALHHIASILDDPPAELSNNLALQALPGCAWFQVEFLMPEDPRNSRDYAAPNTGDPTINQRFDMPLWTQVPVPTGNAAPLTYVFVPDSTYNREQIANQVTPAGTPQPNTRLAANSGFGFQLINPAGPDTVANRRIRTWPYAIRITVKVFDPLGRLTDPIERSIVHRFD